MQLFAQLSDPHLTSPQGAAAYQLLGKRGLGYLSWRRRRRFEHRPEVLAALQEDLAQYRLDQLLVTGDLTHIGLPAEFRQARQWLEQLGDPAQVALVPGNHDACVATRWRDTFALWSDYMASDEVAAGGPGERMDRVFPSLRVRGEIAFIGLSTGCPKPPLMATGTAGAGQLKRLPALLERCRRAGLFRVVYLHHSPLPGTDKWRKRLTDAAAVRAVLSRHGVELVVHGHGHRAHCHQLATSEGPAPVIAVPSASALGLHGADVASYNCYRVEHATGGWRLQVDSRRYCRQTGAFTAAESRSLLLARPA